MKEDKELQEYRDLLKTPTHFEEGFDWKTVVGAIFIGFLMMPGSMYLQLVIGTGIGPAARWVTIILFAELAKRSYSDLKQQEIFLLYYMAGAALHTPFQGLLWNQYLVQSDAARMLGVTEFIPSWVAPPLESIALVERTFFHRDWLIPILLLIGTQIITRVDQFGSGLCPLSDHLRRRETALPHGAGGRAGDHGAGRIHRGAREQLEVAGVLHRRHASDCCSARVYVLLPALSGLVLIEPIRLIPIPWIELTLHTEDWLPAVATGIQLDLGLVFIGMVLPFWAVMGGLGGLDHHDRRQPHPLPTRHPHPLAPRHADRRDDLRQQLRLLPELRHRAGAGHRPDRGLARRPVLRPPGAGRRAAACATCSGRRREGATSTSGCRSASTSSPPSPTSCSASGWSPTSRWCSS